MEKLISINQYERRHFQSNSLKRLIVYGPSLSFPLLIAAVAGIYLLLWAVTWGRSKGVIN